MDNRTLALTLVSLLLGFISVFLVRTRRDRSVTLWALSFVANALGFVLVLLQGSLTPWLSVVLANDLIIGSMVLAAVGVRCYWKLGRAFPWRFGGYLALQTASLVVFSLVWDVYQIRAAVGSLVLAALAIENLVVLVRRGRDLPLALVGFFGGTTVLFALFHLVRSLWSLATANRNFLDNNLVTTWTLGATLAFVLLLAGAYWLLDTHRLQEELASAARRLERLNHLKDRVMAMVAHDLNGSFGAIRSLWTTLVPGDGSAPGPGWSPEIAVLIGRSLEGTEGLLKNLFDFARAQWSDPVPGAMTDLGVAARQVADQFGSAAGAKGVLLEASAQPGPLVVAEPTSVAAVLRNLVSNALKFTPAGGRVDLTAGTDRRGSFVLVADTGLGMDAALVSNLFRVGSRTFRPGTAGERGSGFGLLLVNEMLADQGATLEVESSPGRGTRMTVRFPRD